MIVWPNALMDVLYPEGNAVPTTVPPGPNVRVLPDASVVRLSPGTRPLLVMNAVGVPVGNTFEVPTLVPTVAPVESTMKVELRIGSIK